MEKLRSNLPNLNKRGDVETWKRGSVETWKRGDRHNVIARYRKEG